MILERLEASAFAPKKGLIYFDSRELHSIFDKLAFRSNVILSGPKGIGKSLSLAAFCAARDLPVITFDCSEDVRRAQLLGMFVLRGDTTPFVLGPLTTAFEVANEVGKCVLLLEELNCLAPHSQKILNAATDFRRRLEVPEARRVFALKPEAQLWIAGTMTHAAYGGAYRLNDDLKSRFRVLSLDYPTPAEERQILLQLAGTPKPGLAEKMNWQIDKLLTLAKETRQGTLDYSLSTRDLAQIMEDSELFGLARALWIASGKFEGVDRGMIIKRIESVFGIGASLLK